jgi:hypothetical protein
MKADKLDGKESELFPYELAEKYRKACVSPSSPQAAQMAKHVVQLLKALVVPLQQVRKRHFLRHLYIKAIILPRQARDKHS